MSLDLTGRAGEGHVFTTVPEQRGEVLKYHVEAEKFWKEVLGRANAE